MSCLCASTVRCEGWFFSFCQASRVRGRDRWIEDKCSRVSMANQETTVGFAVKKASAGNACLVVFYYTRYPVLRISSYLRIRCVVWYSIRYQFVLADGLMSVGESLHVPCWVHQVLKYILDYNGTQPAAHDEEQKLPNTIHLLRATEWDCPQCLPHVP